MITVIDFETEAIQDYPDYPPRPVGVSILADGKVEYLAWGHPTGNNCQFEHAIYRLGREWTSGRTLVFHNAKFDIAVAMRWFGLSFPTKFIDTMILLFLDNPNRKKLALKECANDILNLPPVERDEVRDWILTNVPGVKPSQWGAHICKAPGELVGKYADGDTTRTLGLYNALYPKVSETMHSALVREHALVQELMKMEDRGVRVDVDKLAVDTERWITTLGAVEARLLTILGPTDIDSNASLLESLTRVGAVDHTRLLKTDKGSVSVAKSSLDRAVTDRDLLNLLRYRNTLSTLLGTFMVPWGITAGKCKGRLHAQYHQTKGEESGGTRTGRLSSSNPNLQNVPNVQDLILPNGFSPLPVMREYLLPEDGHVWLCGDIKAQEPKLTAHFENGDMMEMYRNDPNVDVYQSLMQVVENSTGRAIKRKHAKGVFLGLVYCMGKDTLAESLRLPAAEAMEIKQAVMSAMPDIVSLVNECKERFKKGVPVMTIGGRLIHCEPPMYVNGGMRSFEYKAINTLIQGSAADQTKQAIIYTGKHSKYPILTSVHDELDMSVPEDEVQNTKEILSAAINTLACDVQMTMSFFSGNNWAEACK